VLGRSRSCDVLFAEPSVSRRHAELRRIAGGWLLVDRASTNGTFVNGVRVQRAHVADGDEIRLGGASVVLRT
jgi:pSer/pThr/pTyr-binding forkhead associated (FHA) protein